MLNIFENIISRILLALIPSAIWTILSYILIYGFYQIKRKDFPEIYIDMFSYIYFSNLVLMTLSFMFFIKDNMKLF